MKNIAVILSGCGHLDGAEIREAVLTLLHIDILGSKAHCFAPNINQHHVINHLNGTESAQSRNVLEEAARIARGKIADLATLDPAKFDAVILPGGYGAAKNLSDLAFKGAEAKMLPELESKLKAFNAAKKPIGTICIAPAVLVAGLRKGKVTIGEDAGTAAAICAMGGSHENKQTPEICVDDENKIVSTSAYMRDDNLAAVNEGIGKLVKKVIELS